MFDTDQKHKQYKYKPYYIISYLQAYIRNTSSKHHIYAQAPLPVIHKTEWVRLGSLVST